MKKKLTVNGTEKFNMDKFRTLSDIINYIESKDYFCGYQISKAEFTELMIQALKIIQNFNIIISDLKHNQEGLLEHLKWLGNHLDSIEEGDKIIKNEIEESMELLKELRSIYKKLPNK